MAKKKHDPQAKAKRQKMIAAVGGVILLGLLAFQLPRTLKLLHPSSATASASQAAPAPTIPAATPVGGAAATSGTAAATSADGLTDPGTAISPQSGQLLAFSRFRSKDPFVQQLKLDCATGQGGDCSTGSGSTSTGSGPGHGGSGGRDRRHRLERRHPAARVRVAPGQADVSSDLGERRRRDRQRGCSVPCLEPRVRAGLAEAELGEDRHRRRHASGRRSGDAEEGPPADADEHGRRHEVRAPAGLRQLAARS